MLETTVFSGAERSNEATILRDIPSSFKDAFLGWIPKAKKEMTFNQNLQDQQETDEQYKERMEQIKQIGTFKKYLPIITTGSGLFSDGYVNNSIGIVSTCLARLYPVEYAQSNAIKNVPSIAFAGIVVGQLIFGYISDYHSRRTGMLWGTIILIVFTILCSGVWGKNSKDVDGMLTALTVYRFFLGIGIGSEYSSSSSSCAEACQLLPPGKRNRWFAWFTNTMIDAGFVASAFVPMVLLWICKPEHLTPVWRVTLGIGAIPPISLFFLRLYYVEGEQYRKTCFKKVRVPYWTVIKFYWLRLLVVSLIWFIYDLSAYSFGLFSSHIIDLLYESDDLYSTFGWNVVFNLFYIPGALLGAVSADYFGPRLTLAFGVIVQSIMGFAMAAKLEDLKKSIGGFVVCYGVFMTMGEFGPGDNIGLLAAKTSSTPIRAQYYAIAAAIGKVGAFVGTYIFTPLTNKYGLKSAWWLGGALGLFSGYLALFWLPSVDQNAMANEDAIFLEYLTSTGFDISQLGDDSVEVFSDRGSTENNEDVQKLEHKITTEKVA